jgi:hypothetical protein
MRIPRLQVQFFVLFDNLGIPWQFIVPLGIGDIP